jgi:hypothetical protein
LSVQAVETFVKAFHELAVGVPEGNHEPSPDGELIDECVRELGDTDPDDDGIVGSFARPPGGGVPVHDSHVVSREFFERTRCALHEIVVHLHGYDLACKVAQQSSLVARAAADDEHSFGSLELEGAKYHRDDVDRGNASASPERNGQIVGNGLAGVPWAEPVTWRFAESREQADFTR